MYAQTSQGTLLPETADKQVNELVTAKLPSNRAGATVGNSVEAGEALPGIPETEVIIWITSCVLLTFLSVTKISALLFTTETNNSTPRRTGAFFLVL